MGLNVIRDPRPKHPVNCTFDDPLLIINQSKNGELLLLPEYNNKFL